MRLILRRLRIEAGMPLRDSDTSLAITVFAYLEALQATDPRTYDRICDEYSEVIGSLRRGDLERSPDPTNLRYFTHQLVYELRRALTND